jgi:hypothetical protein
MRGHGAIFFLAALTAALLVGVGEAPQVSGKAVDAEEDPANAGEPFFEGSKSDPRLCVMEGDEKVCCGTSAKKPCRGARFLHPVMRPLAACLADKLHLGGDKDRCPGGIGETFRGMALQDSYKSLGPGWSLHNYGLAFDACCYFKSKDCSKSNLINIAVGGIKTWKKKGETRCQAAVRMDKSVKSKEAALTVTGLKAFKETLPLVESCYEEAGLTFGKWSWGVGWKDYFDAPHFQYLPSAEAGFYKKKSDRKNGAHIFMKLHEDCYGGDRLTMLKDLYAADRPEALLEARKEGCGSQAYALYQDFIKNVK